MWHSRWSSAGRSFWRSTQPNGMQSFWLKGNFCSSLLVVSAPAGNHIKAVNVHFCCRRELAPLLQHMQQQRAEMAASRSAVTDWIEYLSCSPLPDPRDVPAMTGYLATVVQEADTTDLHKTLQQCEVSCGEKPPTGLHTLAGRGRMFRR